MKFIGCFLILCGLIVATFGVTFTEVVQNKGQDYPCMYQTETCLCDYLNGTFGCMSFSDYVTNGACPGPMLAFSNCSTCYFYGPMNICHRTNHTNNSPVYVNETSPFEVCTTVANCSALFNETLAGVDEHQLEICLDSVDCCFGYNKTYWKTHNSRAASPNNIAWPNSLESAYFCATPSYAQISYLSIMNATDAGNLTITLLQQELITYYINDASMTIERGYPGLCLNATEQQVLDNARAFIVSLCGKRYTPQNYADAAVYLYQVQDINNILIC